MQPGIGQNIRIGKLSCEVIGVLKPKGAGGMGQDNDDLILMPLRVFQQRISGNHDITMIFATERAGRSTGSLKN
jgi:putative ABC transport system permease protein